MDYLGQRVPPQYSDPNKENIFIAIKNIVATNKTKLSKVVEVYVTSKNALKTEAATTGVSPWVTMIFGADSEIKVNTIGIEVSSDIGEQPCGDEITMKGAANRLHNMKNTMQQNGTTCESDPSVLRILVSLENGICLEKVSNLKNPDVFEVRPNSGESWVDRCYCISEIWLGAHKWTLTGISEGVTTPRDTVKMSEESGWTKTAGSFIAEIYKWNAKDWHGSIAGKGRLPIMKELIQSVFVSNHHCAVAVPVKTATFKPDVYHQYETEQVDFFVPKDIAQLLKNEKRKPDDTEGEDMDVDMNMWRSVYQDIPQLNKPGADGTNPINSSGVILTEDIIVGYFDEINGQDTLYVILIWSKIDDMYKERGWCLPGKRDRAYDKHHGDISVADANFSLVEKEIGVSRNCIAYHTVLGYFDDRKREQRMKSSGFVSFVLLDSKPQLVTTKMVAVPLSALVQLAKREIRIQHIPNTSASEMFGLTRNHDSLLLSIFETTKFFHTMNNIKLAQVKYKQTKKFAVADIDMGFECGICTDLMVDSKIVCKNGHTVCGICLQHLKNGTCPFCRGPLLSSPIPNLHLENVIQTQYPKKYEEKYRDRTGSTPSNWQSDAMFNGSVLFY